MLSAVGFLRFADRLESLSPDVRRTIEALAAGDVPAALAAAGERGSPTWWAAERFMLALADAGVALEPPRRAPAPRTVPMFAD